MFEFAKKLMLGRLLELKEGEIDFMSVPVAIIPIDVLIDLQKALVKSIGYPNAYEKLYNGSKEGSISYNKHFIEKYGFKNIEKIAEWQSKIVTVAGWGKTEWLKIDCDSKTATVRFTNSPFIKGYGSSKCPACIIQTGFAAAGANLFFQQDVDAIETRCVAKGDPYCEVQVAPPKIIKEKRQEQWRKLGIVGKTKK